MNAILKKNASFGLKKFPVSIWNYTNLAEHGQWMTEAEMESLAEAGITVPHAPGLDPTDKAQKKQMLQLLDWAAERDMKLIPWDPRCMARVGADGKPVPDYADGVRAAVADFGSHPGLFGFYVCDEPGGQVKDGTFACQRMQKEIAPHLFPFLNHLPHFPGFETGMGHATWGDFLDEYVAKSNADFLCYDCYAQMLISGADLDSYYRNLRFYREASQRNGIPFWNTVMSVGHMAYRCPTLDDVRWQFNTSVASGAHGVSWFFWYMKQPQCNYRLSPVDEYWEKTQGYYDIRRVQKAFHRQYGDLFNRLASTRVTFFSRTYGGGEAWTPNE
ncbi:MAG: hypothetical protein NT031_02055, partial [Planctomycetota bacterium]|nr:hypothetical protein [Planctomycetota bacterium]